MDKATLQLPQCEIPANIPAGRYVRQGVQQLSGKPSTVTAGSHAGNAFDRQTHQTCLRTVREKMIVGHMQQMCAVGRLPRLPRHIQAAPQSRPFLLNFPVGMWNTPADGGPQYFQGVAEHHLEKSHLRWVKVGG